MNNGYLFILLAILTRWGSNLHFGCTPQNEHDKTESAVSSSGILKNVVKHAPKVSSKEINDSEIRIAKMAHEEENKRLQKMGKCAKDYTLPCPKFWKKKIMNKSENICIASSTYNGFCNTRQSFDNFTQTEKMKFETSCNVEWGCKNVVADACESGKRNYNEPCPEGFISQNDNTCAADLTVYDGLCNGEKIDFTHLTSEEKQNWSVACEAYWPCYVDCSLNNQALSMCPSNWKQINSYECIPPHSYNGPCKDTKNFKFFNELMKIKFEEKCKVTFVCTDLCEKNYRQECPLNWMKKNGYCLAPPSFNLCDRKKYFYSNLTQDEKKKFEEECSVQWPCRKSPFCDMDWTAECPLNWAKEAPRKGGDQEQGDKYNCTPDSSLYNGKCAFMSLPNGADEETKRELASTCDTPWPCSATGIAEGATAEGGPLPPSDDEGVERRARAVTNGPVTLQGGVHTSTGPAYRVVDSQEDLPLADIMR
ncbi:hypothetical protein AK88_04027 [Plasmodium fragile]|uniref:CPW-WPC domain-containing protein n=1 Tax=Plasmodium fragile TaxID=5857 RepID=A0A0D9QH67_PLAFR|nr:uncharacterized protein AK88_04027 [Plasmodium fragile]KJP86308.1 hypothetical protein AK88_04027 [Plasmodium fragile]